MTRSNASSSLQSTSSVPLVAHVRRVKSTRLAATKDRDGWCVREKLARRGTEGSR